MQSEIPLGEGRRQDAGTGNASRWAGRTRWSSVRPNFFRPWSPGWSSGRKQGHELEVITEFQTAEDIRSQIREVRGTRGAAKCRAGWGYRSGAAGSRFRRASCPDSSGTGRRQRALGLRARDCHGQLVCRSGRRWIARTGDRAAAGRDAGGTDRRCAENPGIRSNELVGPLVPPRESRGGPWWLRSTDRHACWRLRRAR